MRRFEVVPSRRWVAPALAAVVVGATALGLHAGSRSGPVPAFAGWMCVAGAAYLGMLAAHRWWSGLTVGTVVAAGTGLGLVALSSPPRATGDLWMYAVYGRMATHRLNPWTQVPALLPRDAVVRAAGHRWMHTPSMYGPVMVWIERVLAPFAGSSLFLTRLEYQAIALVAVGASAVIVWRRTRAAAAVAFLVVNPLVAVHLVNGGRNDALVGLALLVATVLVTDGHDALPGIVAALAVLVKLTAGVGVVALVVWLLVRRGWVPALRAACAATAVVAVGTALAGPSSLMVPFRRAGQIISRGSGWVLLHRLHLGTPPSRVAVLVAAAVMVVVLARHLRGGPALAVAAGLAAWTLGLPYLLAGYLGWTLPVAGLERRSRVAAVVAVESVGLLVGYAVVRNSLIAWSGPVPGILVLAMPVIAVVGLGVLLFDGGRPRRPRTRRRVDGLEADPHVDAGDTRTLVVVPTYNEVANVEPLLRRVRRALPAADVLVVDDGSPDGTAARVVDLAAELDGIALLSRDAPTGLGSAYRAGFRYALEHGYGIVCEMDADLSHEPEAVPVLVEAVAGGADLAVGSRYVPGGRTVGWPWRRRVLSRLGGGYARVVLRLEPHDVTSGFRAYRTDLLRRIDVDTVTARGFGFQIEMTARAARAGARVVEVPITFHERVAGCSKMSRDIVTEALVVVARMAVDRHRRPERPRAVTAPRAVAARP